MNREKEPEISDCAPFFDGKLIILTFSKERPSSLFIFPLIDFACMKDKNKKMILIIFNIIDKKF